MIIENRIRLWLKFAIGVCLCVFLSACTSPLRKATDQFRSGAYSQSLETLEEKSDKIADRDLLLLRLNKGLVLHQLGRFKDSNLELLAAASIIEELSRASISEQVSTLAVNEWAGSYRGEYSEQLWVHSYLMMNFLLLGDGEGAAVEARRALKVFAEQPDSLKNAYFTRALMAISFEQTGLINDAYIEYKQLADSEPASSNIADKLYSQALQLGIDSDVEQYRRDYFSDGTLPSSKETTEGELIVFLSEGDIPYKTSSNVFFPPDIRLSWPEYNYAYTPTDTIDIYTENSLVPYKIIESDFAALARTSLYNRGKSIAIKQALRVGAKHNIVNKVGDQNALAGGLLQVALFVLEEADTRGWDTLPSTMSILRIPLEPGNHTVTLDANGVELTAFADVVIKKGQTTFRQFRVEPFVGQLRLIKTPHKKPISVEYRVEESF